jgi:hypothetical protein
VYNGANGVGIASIAKTNTVNNVDTYTITYTDATTLDYTVINGTGIEVNGTDTEAGILGRTGDPVNTFYVATDTNEGYVWDGTTWNPVGPIEGNGIVDITRTAGDGSAGTTDTYTITFSKTAPTTFDVYNGADGETIDHVTRTAGTGAAGTVDTYTVWKDAGETVSAGTFDVYNGADSAVVSVAGKTGDVILTEADITDLDKYTQAEVDTALGLKADQATTYTKTEVDTALGLKADQSTTYTKTEVDNAITANTQYNYTTKTANYTAVAKDFIYADTSGGAFTVTLPATPTADDRVAIVDNTTSFSTNNLTIGINGGTIMGIAEDMVVDIDNISFELIYNGSDWRLV